MTVVLVPILALYGAGAVPVVGIMAGLMLLGAAGAGLGRYLAFIPWPVVEGFTVGIAVIIFLQQVPAALGVSKPHGENTAAVAFRAIGNAFDHGQWTAIAVVAIVIASMILAPKVHRAAPTSLVAVVIATIVAQMAGWDLAQVGKLPASLPTPSFPSFSADQISNLFSAALAIAALAAIESLLSAKVADGMADTTPHDPDRELFGQGLANIAAPMFGGMPATGAIARTAVNVRAGARTRVASIVHSVVLILVVFFGGPLVARIPLASLASVLMVTAVRMIEVATLTSILRSTRSDAAVLALTAVATIAFDLILAVEIGVALAAILALRAIAQSATATAEPITNVEIDASTEAALLHDHIVAYRLDGALFFGAAQRFLTELSAVSDVRVVILRLSQLQVLDATEARALGDLVAELEHRGVTVLIKGTRPDHLRLLGTVGALGELADERHVFTDLDAAVAHARIHVQRSAA